MSEGTSDPYEPPGTDEVVAPRRDDTVGRGVLLVLGGHVVAAVLVALFTPGALGEVLLMTFFFAGVVQWVYVVPMLIVCYARGLRQTAKGVWIIAGAAVLPTAACFGTLMVAGFH